MIFFYSLLLLFYIYIYIILSTKRFSAKLMGTKKNSVKTEGCLDWRIGNIKSGIVLAWELE